MSENKVKRVCKRRKAGERFGMLVTIAPTGRRQNGCIVWECKCDCGNTVFAASGNLVSGNTTSCGCKRGKDITGHKYGKLTAIRATDKRKNGCIVWECICDCGIKVNVPISYLCNGTKRSCGVCNAKYIKTKRTKDNE